MRKFLKFNRWTALICITLLLLFFTISMFIENSAFSFYESAFGTPVKFSYLNISGDQLLPHTQNPNPFDGSGVSAVFFRFAFNFHLRMIQIVRNLFGASAAVAINNFNNGGFTGLTVGFLLCGLSIIIFSGVLLWMNTGFKWKAISVGADAGLTLFFFALMMGVFGLNQTFSSHPYQPPGVSQLMGLPLTLIILALISVSMYMIYVFLLRREEITYGVLPKQKYSKPTKYQLKPLPPQRPRRQPQPQINMAPNYGQINLGYDQPLPKRGRKQHWQQQPNVSYPNMMPPQPNVLKPNMSPLPPNPNLPVNPIARGAQSPLDQSQNVFYQTAASLNYQLEIMRQQSEQLSAQLQAMENQKNMMANPMLDTSRFNWPQSGNVGNNNMQVRQAPAGIDLKDQQAYYDQLYHMEGRTNRVLTKEEWASEKNLQNRFAQQQQKAAPTFTNPFSNKIPVPNYQRQNPLNTPTKTTSIQEQTNKIQTDLQAEKGTVYSKINHPFGNPSPQESIILKAKTKVKHTNPNLTSAHDINHQYNSSDSTIDSNNFGTSDPSFKK